MGGAHHSFCVWGIINKRGKVNEQIRKKRGPADHVAESVFAVHTFIGKSTGDRFFCILSAEACEDS